MKIVKHWTKSLGKKPKKNFSISTLIGFMNLEDELRVW